MRCALPMRVALSLALVALSGWGCASSAPGSDLPGQDKPARVSEAGGSSLRIRPNDPAATSKVLYPVDQVWRVLPAVFDSLGIPIGTLEPATRVIGNSGMKVHKRLGQVMLSRYIDCGQAQGFPSAETYDVHLSVLTQVMPTDSVYTVVATMVEAAARPMAFRGDYTRCTSKGELESQIAAGVRARLSR